MQFLFWAIPPYDLDDVALSLPMSARNIRDLTFKKTPVNMLAAVLFIGRHGDASARAQCTLMPFPIEPTSTRVDVKEGR